MARPLFDTTIPQLLSEAAERWPDRPAVKFREETWNYRQLEEMTDELAAGLWEHGVCPGDHVAIMAENMMRTVFSFYAVLKTGAVACMVSTGLKAAELTGIFQISDIDHLLLGNHYKDNYFYEEYKQMEHRYPVKTCVDIGTPTVIPKERGCSWEDLMQEGRQILQEASGAEKLNSVKSQVSPKDPCLMLYTSGTTGSLPKAVVSTQYHLANGGIQKAYSQRMTERDVVCCALQMFHIFCIDVNMLAALSSGACLVIPEDLHSYSILKTIEKEYCTVLSAVPCTFQVMAEREDFSSFDCSSLRTGIIGGAYCSRELFQKIDRAFGFTLLPGLGQTEATAGITICELSDDLETRSTTVGHFVPHMEGSIRDVETGEEVRTGRTGEVWIRGKLLMSGYYKQPKLTKEAIDEEGWLHTGDLGWLDERNYLHLNGRMKDIINRGGEKVMPVEVENQIELLDAVAECAVIGIPDHHYGEEICACMVLEKDMSATESEVREFLKTKLAHYKIPKYMFFLDAFPWTETGKVKKKELKKRILNQMKENEERSMNNETITGN